MASVELWLLCIHQMLICRLVTIVPFAAAVALAQFSFSNSSSSASSSQTVTAGSFDGNNPFFSLRAHNALADGDGYMFVSIVSSGNTWTLENATAEIQSSNGTQHVEFAVDGNAVTVTVRLDPGLGDYEFLDVELAADLLDSDRGVRALFEAEVLINLSRFQSQSLVN